MTSNVSKVSDVVEQIAKNANEQATSISEINTSIAQLDIVTQKIAAMVDVTTDLTADMFKGAHACVAVCLG
ncbi:MAG: hypothetical protein V7695_12475 [Sulfitobacter sp.]